jgi:hypothetical protein
MDRRTRWVFVAGEGRSGTTLLGVLVAQATGAFNCGELRQLWDRMATGGRCECGVELAQCEIWSAVAADVRRTLGAPARELIGRYTRPLRRHEKLRFTHPDAGSVVLRRTTEEAVERVTGASVLVDASKGPSDLAAAMQRPRPLLVLHLVRDPRGVTFSWRRSKPLPSDAGLTIAPAAAWKIAVLWSRNNQLIERLLRGARASGSEVLPMRLTYEQLASDPERMLAAITRAALYETMPAGGQPGHGIVGNAALYEARPVVVDDRWTHEMSWWDKATASVLTAPFLHHYGYPLWPPTRPTGRGV